MTLGMSAQNHVLERGFESFALRRLTIRSDIEDFAKLRYRTWLDEGYVEPHTLPNTCEMEMDFFDFYSKHFGIFSPDDKLIGGVRLILEGCLGEVEHIDLLNQICLHSEDPVLGERVNNQRMIALPFDLIESFPEYVSLFRVLRRNNIAIAELSRLIIDPEFRNRGLARELVVFLVDLARKLGIGELVLTCGTGMESFYSSCGFRRLDCIAPGRFGDIKVKSIVMSQTLD